MNCEAKHMKNLIFKEKKSSVQRKKYANLGSGSQIKDRKPLSWIVFLNSQSNAQQQLAMTKANGGRCLVRMVGQLVSSWMFLFQGPRDKDPSEQAIASQVKSYWERLNQTKSICTK